MEIEKGNNVLLFIDELNRCEHAVQQELMNLILNREINGYKLNKDVKILAAMNPSNEYGAELIIKLSTWTQRKKTDLCGLTWNQITTNG